MTVLLAGNDKGEEMVRKTKTPAGAEKKMTKLNVIAAVEPTNGINPKRALEEAMKIPEKPITRVFIADYMPALEALMAKGYTQAESAEILVSLGCPFKPAAIVIRYRELKRQGKPS